MEIDSVNCNNQFTCITCRVAFRDLEIQRLHYQTDWHRYNLKRKVAELPSITSEEFKKRALTHQADEQKKIQFTTEQCKMCNKSFNTKNQYKNHILSKKHHDNELKYNIKEQDAKNIETSSSDTDSWTLLPPNNDAVKIKQPETVKSESMDTECDVESVDSDEDPENPVEQNNCLFCDHHSKSWVRNLKHMTEKHSFFLADFDYCVDPKGLLEYLGEKIYLDYLCIWCTDRFYSSDAARAHMVDKRHCKMLHEDETLVEYAGFYDYSSTYPDVEDDPDPDDDVYLSSEHDDQCVNNDLDYDVNDLILPSGRIAGHRSLMRYFKQHNPENRVVTKSNNEKIRKVLFHYRASGWTGSDKAQIVKKARDIKYMQRLRSKYSTQLNFKANKFQKHYRAQVNF